MGTSAWFFGSHPGVRVACDRKAAVGFLGQAPPLPPRRHTRGPAARLTDLPCTVREGFFLQKMGVCVADCLKLC